MAKHNTMIPKAYLVINGKSSIGAVDTPIESKYYIPSTKFKDSLVGKYDISDLVRSNVESVFIKEHGLDISKPYQYYLFKNGGTNVVVYFYQDDNSGICLVRVGDIHSIH